MSWRQVDGVFYQRLSKLLRIIVPGIRSREARMLVLFSALLVFRTAISLYVAVLDGKWVTQSSPPHSTLCSHNRVLPCSGLSRRSCVCR